MKQIGTINGYRVILDGSREGGREFWATVGPLFADRQIRKEMEGPLENTDHYEWVLVLDGDRIAAFASLDTERLESKSECWLTNAYVFPEYRSKGIHDFMFKTRLMMARDKGAKIIKGLATPSSRKVFEAHGFEKISERGKFYIYQLTIGGEA